MGSYGNCLLAVLRDLNFMLVEIHLRKSVFEV